MVKLISKEFHNFVETQLLCVSQTLPTETEDDRQFNVSNHHP
jgi:hypothetical protein